MVVFKAHMVMLCLSIEQLSASSRRTNWLPLTNYNNYEIKIRIANIVNSDSESNNSIHAWMHQSANRACHKLRRRNKMQTTNKTDHPPRYNVLSKKLIKKFLQLF